MTTLSWAEYVATLESMRASAGMVLRDESGRVLLLREHYRPERLGVPGGAVDPGESPRAAAAREVREEVGLDVVPGRLLCVDYRSETGQIPSPFLHFLFDGGVLGDEDIAAIVPQPEEVISYHLVPAADAPGLAGDWLGPRLAVALRALADGTTYYCEEGEAL